MEEYRLIGIGNAFSITPGFITPIFIKNNWYYTMEIDEYTKQTYFKKLSLAHIDMITSLNELSVNYLNVKSSYNENDELIGAFQLTDNEILIGQLDLLLPILEEFQTDDELVKKEIQDYTNEMIYYQSIKNNKSR